jgi:hypothetical protein
VRKSNAQRRDIAGRLRRTYGKRVYLKLSTETMRNKLLDYGVLEFRYQNGKKFGNQNAGLGLYLMTTLKFSTDTIGKYEDFTTTSLLLTTVLNCTISGLLWSTVCIKPLLGNIKVQRER